MHARDPRGGLTPRAGTRRTVSHLLDHGHPRIAYFGGRYDIWPQAERQINGCGRAGSPWSRAGGEPAHAGPGSPGQPLATRAIARVLG